FLPEKTPEPFLKRNLEKTWSDGDIVALGGEKVGEHRGLPFYTIGQRKGLELGGLPEPMFVVGKDEMKNQIIVGKRDEGFQKNIRLRNLNIVHLFDEARPYGLKTRGAGEMLQGKVKRVGEPYRGDSGELWDGEVELVEAIKGVTPGQFVVIYDGEFCLGGGEIVG